MFFMENFCKMLCISIFPVIKHSTPLLNHTQNRIATLPVQRQGRHETQLCGTLSAVCHKDTAPGTFHHILQGPS